MYIKKKDIYIKLNTLKLGISRQVRQVQVVKPILFPRSNTWAKDRTNECNGNMQISEVTRIASGASSCAISKGH